MRCTGKLQADRLEQLEALALDGKVRHSHDSLLPLYVILPSADCCVERCLKLFFDII